MSLLLNLLRQLLEYYGVAPGLLLHRCEVCLNRIAHMIGSHLSSNAFSRTRFQELCAISRRCLVSLIWERKKYGSTRSFVRRLGKYLSLMPCPRPHIQLLQNLNYSESEQASTLSAVTPSLADVLWVPDDGNREAYAKFRFVEWRKIVTAADPLPAPSTENIVETTTVDEHAFKKISALENELAHLRRQIAAIIAVHRAGNDSSLGSSNTPSSLLHQTAVTSTPIPVSPHSMFVPPPPPPPPPPVLLSNFDSCSSATQLLKEHRTPNKRRNITDSSGCQEAKTVPCMMDVLKDINKVRLRAVERSPGGTPLPKTKKIMQSQWDPATLIAEALKEKFASHLNLDDSSDKENRSWDASPFSSPDTPMVGSHILKTSMKQTLCRPEKLMHTTATKTRVQV
ncbi:hypothetical protein JRQ81_008031 [Phrynocephalus forsythii]|uniref:Mitochondrial fission regulator n=1 Tax=Phrynocephalus forsythii TaxID=171643 RepID=A0A9Q0Y3Z8_9SAUR|nr:hypothetical protein JRQ81_008031 [Phrynocephalus forsythii]